MDTPRISVLVPSYNHASYIGRAIESVLRQTLEPLEIVVVDDGSIDETAAALAPYADRTRFFRRPHGGIAATYRFGLEQARGDWVALLESDDLWAEEYLEECTAFLAAHPDTAWVSTARALIDDRDRPTGEFFGKRTAGPYYSTEGFLLHDMGRATTPLARREALLSLAPFRENTHAVDSDLSLRFSVRYRMGHVARPVYLYRRHASNASGNRVRDALELLKILRDFQRERGPWVRANERTVRRGVAKFAGRTAALMLEADPDTPRDRVMPLFGEALRQDPLGLKHLRRYLAVLLLGPMRYGRIRRRGRRRTEAARSAVSPES